MGFLFKRYGAPALGLGLGLEHVQRTGLWVEGSPDYATAGTPSSTASPCYLVITPTGAPVVYCMALSALCLGFGLLVFAPFSPAARTGLLNPSPDPNPNPSPDLNPKLNPYPNPNPEPCPPLSPTLTLTPTLPRRSPASSSSAASRP